MEQIFWCWLWSPAPAQAHYGTTSFNTCFTMSFRPLTGKEKHYSLAQKICLFPAVLREHLENRRTNKLLNIRRDDVSKPIALLDQIHAQIFSLKELDVSAPCRVISRHANEWWMCKHVMTCLECLGPLCEYMVKECQEYVDSKKKDYE